MRVRARRLTAVLLAVLSSGLVGLPSAALPTGGDHVDAGHIVVGHPASIIFPSAAELTPQCIADPPSEGGDGVWIKLPDGADGYGARVDFTSPVAADIGVRFYDSNCSYMVDEFGGLSTAGVGHPEVGYIPEFARWAVVNGLLGADINFTFTVFLSQPPVLTPPGPRMQLARVESFEITRDGVGLRGHIYIPQGLGPFATVLELNPYWNWALPRSDGMVADYGVHKTMRGELRHFLEAGFAVALVNVRGAGLSDGCLQWGNQVDIDDTGAVIEAIADLNWSNGSVGMTGLSWGGWTSYMGIASRAPSLKAVIPMSGVMDLWNFNSIRGAGHTAQYSLLARAGFGAAAALSGNDPLNPTARPCEALAGEIQSQVPLWNGDRNDYYRERDLRPKIKGTTVPIFTTGGLKAYESLYEPGEQTHILQFEGLWQLATNVRMMLGRWGHATPTGVRPDFPKMAVAWMDHYLRGGPMTIAPGVVEYQDDQGAWHTTTSWPPTTEGERLWLSGEELTPRKKSVVRSARSYTGVGQACMRICVVPETEAQACIPNHVAYASEPLTTDVELAGNFRIDMRLSSTLPDGHAYAYLIEADTGECPDASARVLARAITDLRHIVLEEGTDFHNSHPRDVSVLSLPFAATARAGKRLVVVIGGDGYETIYAADPWRPTVTMHTGPDVPSVVRLPVVSGVLTLD